MTHYEFGLMSYLRAMPDATASTSEIAEATNTTLPRVSLVCPRLKGRGLVEKSISPTDRRVSMATLTASVRRKLIRATPRHIATARRLVIDALSPEDLAHLSRITGILGKNLDPSHGLGLG